MTLSVTGACAADPHLFRWHVALGCPDFPLVRALPRQHRRAITPAHPDGRIYEGEKVFNEEGRNGGRRIEKWELIEANC